MRRKQSDETKAIHIASEAKLIGRTVSPPVQRASTVILPDARSLYDHSQVSYGRVGLQPQNALCEALCAMEGGAGARLFPNGLSAMTGPILGLLKTGDDILVVDSVYAPTRRFCEKVLARFGVGIRYFDPAASVGEIESLCLPNTRLIVLESPGSLTFEVLDVPAIAAMARKRGVWTIIDNTWGAGVYFKPLDHGVDISVQALTKYVGGHSDVFMGAAVARDEGLVRKLDDAILHMGWGASPDDAYLMLRGLRTLPTRLARHGENAVAIAQWLEAQAGVKEVICPALPGSRGHEIWARDFKGQNGLIGLVLEAAETDAVYAFLDALELFGLGFSWGGYESLAILCDPQFAARQRKPDFGGPLIRLHVGLEGIDDLKADLAAALTAFAAARKQDGQSQT